MDRSWMSSPNMPELRIGSDAGERPWLTLRDLLKVLPPSSGCGLAICPAAVAELL
jgi:hypothetical protein